MRKLTVRMALVQYYGEHVAAECHDKDRIRIALRHLTDFFGDMLADRIEASDIKRYCADRGTGGGTLRRELGALKAAMNYAVACRRLDRAPPIKLPKAPAPKGRWLTEDEAARLIDASLTTKFFGEDVDSETTRVYMFIMIALNTGARKSAIEELEWDQVDFERGTINFNQDGREQTSKRRPVVPISDELMPALERVYSMTTDGYVLGHKGDIRTSFNNAAKRAGLDGVTPHTLRHTWATWAAQAGVGMWDIAGVLGDDEGTVRTRYAHHSPEHLRAAVNFRSKA